MFENIFTAANDTALTVNRTLLIIISSLILGLLISLVYIKTHKNNRSQNFTVTMIMLPAIIAIIILLVGNNIARAFSLAGAFSLIRFRSAPGVCNDIAYVFFSLGVGLACGIGYIGYAVLFAIILCSVMSVLSLTKYGKIKHPTQRLRITVPEDMDYENVFEDILKEYTGSCSLSKVRTVDFGSLFELAYDITLKENINTKEMIDKLRCCNGNLRVLLSMREQDTYVSF